MIADMLDILDFWREYFQDIFWTRELGLNTDLDSWECSGVDSIC